MQTYEFLNAIKDLSYGRIELLVIDSLFICMPEKMTVTCEPPGDYRFVHQNQTLTFTLTHKILQCKAEEAKMKVPEKARDKTQAHRQAKESASNSQPHWDHLFLFHAD